MTEVADLAAPSLSLPWLARTWARLQQSRDSGRLAHALLVCGPRGVGKRHLVERLAASLVCRERLADGAACGRCADCRLFAAGSHPDLIRVGPDPEAKSDEITVGAVRAFAQRESLTPSRADWKVAILDPADRLNPAAANALLKTLEEPAGRTLICLVAERIGQLPATVRSRCLQIRVPVPDASESLAWLRAQGLGGDLTLRLALAQGAPRRALADLDQERLEQRQQRLAGFLALAEGRADPLAEAAAWNALGPVLFLEWLAGWLCDLLRLMVAERPGRLDNPDQLQGFAALARRLDPAAGHRFLQRVLAARALAQTNVNHLLLLESLAIDWSGIIQGESPRGL